MVWPTVSGKSDFREGWGAEGEAISVSLPSAITHHCVSTPVRKGTALRTPCSLLLLPP